MKIALFGGSFDPPHNGHNAIVKTALKELDIDKIIIIPTFISPFKISFKADENKRFEWVKIIWGNLEKVEISDYELLQKRPVPSIETVEFFEKKYKCNKIYFIIGADHLEKLSSWHRYDELCKKVEFVVARRGDIKIPNEFKILDINVDISSSFIREKLYMKAVDEHIKDDVLRSYSKDNNEKSWKNSENFGG